MMNKRFHALALLCSVCAALPAGAREIRNAVRSLAADDSVQAVAALAPTDLQTPMPVSVSLAMRNTDELQQRLNRGENLANGKITAAEMESRYLPSADDYRSVRDWLVSQGFAVSVEDPNHTTVSVIGTAQQAGQAFSVDFARVTTADGTFVSAVGDPTVPDALPAVIVGVGGLQPHHLAHTHAVTNRAANRNLATGDVLAINTPFGSYLSPGDLRNAYNASSSDDGTGVQVAVIIDGPVLATDLALFYKSANVSTTADQVTNVSVNGASVTTLTADSLETALDVETITGMATSAKVRVYVIPSLSDANIQAALVQILHDHQTITNLSVVNMSFGGAEIQAPTATLRALSQSFAQVSAAGITLVAASGDAGSNPNATDESLGYDANSPLSVEYPASDPNVTGVGGTNVTFTANLLYGSETVWSEIKGARFDNLSVGAGGGGVSGFFARPSWQTGTGAAFGQNTSQRLVPDVSAMSVGTLYSNFIPVQVISNGELWGVEGTSLAAPIWSAIAAFINQARLVASPAQGPIGLMNPLLYQYAPANTFRDITTGNNGAYSAAAGFDLATGLGTPQISTLVPILSGSGPTIDLEPSDLVVEATQVTYFSLSVSGVPAPNYQWQRKAAGSSTWVNLSDYTGQIYRGANADTLYIFNTTQAMDLDQFQCIVSNALGTAISIPATMHVVPYINPFPTASSPATHSGGGGAVSPWFLAALTALGLARFAQRRHRRLA